MKFLDLLNKPVSFRRRSPTDEASDKEATQSDVPASVQMNIQTNLPVVGITHSSAPPAAPPATLSPRPATTGDPLALLSQQIDEVALLFATEQPDAAIALLDASLSSALRTSKACATDTEQRAWCMLLELYAAQGAHAEFDRTALAYAQRFEASPPQWRPAGLEKHASTHAPQATANLILKLRDRLDASAQPLLAQWRRRSATASNLSLDLAQISTVDLAGCRALLELLGDWQQRGLQVHLQACDTTLARLRGLIQSGRRDDDDAGWRLLIELLRLGGDVERYEDACLAYSLTYEMSPPAAPPPVIRTRPVTGQGASCGATFALPELITLPIEPLLAALRVHAQQHTDGARALVLDASCVQRIDFHAAGALQASLAELAAGKPVKWQEVSFLVSTLLQLTCGNAMPGIINRMP